MIQAIPKTTDTGKRLPYNDSRVKVEPADERRDPDEKVKDADLYRRKAERLYWSYINGYSALSYGRSVDFNNQRRYAQGTQPNIKYMDSICPMNPKTGKREGYDVISWDNFPVMAKLRAVVLGKFDPIDYAVSVNCIDENSNKKRDLEKLMYYIEQKDKEFYNGVYQSIGVKPDEPKMPYKPTTLEDLNIIEEIGSFKLAAEIEMEGKLRKCLDHSEWSELKKRLLEDAFDLAFIATKDYNDPITKEPKVRYIDPEFLLVRYTRSNSFEDIAEWAEIKFYTIQQLKQMGVPAQDLHKCIRGMSGLFGNAGYYNLSFDMYMNNPTRFEEIKVAILDGEFDTLDTDFYEMSPDGRIFNTPWGSDKPRKKENKLVKSSYDKWYRYKWVIGTDVVFDYGYQFDQVYDQHNKPKASLSCYRIADRSIVSSCIATIDDLEITMKKLRLAIANARPSGLSIDIASLNSVDIGGGTYDPFQLIKLLTLKGHLLYRAAIAPNGMLIQGAPPPVTELKGGIGAELEELLTLITMFLNHLRELSGISQVIDGSNPIPGQLVGVTEAQEAGTNNVLRPMLSAYQYIKRITCRKLAWRIQLNAKVQKYKSFGDAVLSSMEDITEPTMDVMVEVLIDEQMVAKIDAMANESIKAAKQGQAGITMADYFFIQRCLQVGQLKYAQFYLSAREYESQQTLLEQQKQMQQLNNQGAISLEQEKQKTLQMEMQLRQMEIELTKQWDYKTAMAKAAVDSHTKLQVADMNNDTKENVAAMKPAPAAK